MTFLLPVWAFVKRLNLSQIALIAMAALCLFLKLSLASEQRHSAKLETQLVKATAELQRISTKRDEQKATTREKVKESEVAQREADKVAERIETSPVPGNCKTAPEIMGADL